MARKPEAQAVSNVHKKLNKLIYYEGMANPYSGGTPDVYYDGPGGDLWVEYKFLPKTPPVVLLTNPKASVKLSALQNRWLNRAHDNGRNVAVVVLTPGKKGCYLYQNRQWELPIKREIFEACLRSRQEIADWIAEQVLNDDSSYNEA